MLVVGIFKVQNHFIQQAFSELLPVHSHSTTVVLKGDGATPWWAFWKSVEYFSVVLSRQPVVADVLQVMGKCHTTKNRPECHGTFHVPVGTHVDEKPVYDDLS